MRSRAPSRSRGRQARRSPRGGRSATCATACSWRSSDRPGSSGRPGGRATRGTRSPRVRLASAASARSSYSARVRRPSAKASASTVSITARSRSDARIAAFAGMRGSWSNWLHISMPGRLRHHRQRPPLRRWAECRAPSGAASVAGMSTPIDLGRPVSGDVIDLILEDHRRFESLMRQLRDSTSDRDAVRRALAALHVAHAEAEEKHVYPSCAARTRSPSTRPSTARRSTPRATRRC